MWNEIKYETDLRNFMDMHNSFHDSCLKEFKFISGAYVNEDLSMHPINDKRILKIIIQRQFAYHSVIELEFLDLKYLKIFPSDEDYTCEILGSTMILKDDCIYWCDCGELTEEDMESYRGIVVCASRARWRVADEYIGSKEVYVST